MFKSQIWLGLTAPVSSGSPAQGCVRQGFKSEPSRTPSPGFHRRVGARQVISPEESGSFLPAVSPWTTRSRWGKLGGGGVRRGGGGMHVHVTVLSMMSTVRGVERKCWYHCTSCVDESRYLLSQDVVLDRVGVHAAFDSWIVLERFHLRVHSLLIGRISPRELVHGAERISPAL